MPAVLCPGCGAQVAIVTGMSAASYIGLVGAVTCGNYPNCGTPAMAAAAAQATQNQIARMREEERVAQQHAAAAAAAETRRRQEAERRVREAEQRERERKRVERAKKQAERETKVHQRDVASHTLAAEVQKVADAQVIITRLAADLTKGRERSSELTKKQSEIEKRIANEKSHLSDDLLIDASDSAAAAGDVRVLNALLFGPTGHGKSTTGNALVQIPDGGAAFVVGDGADSVTATVKTVQSQRDCGVGRVLRVTDTPGSGDSAGGDEHYMNALVQHLRGIGSLDAIVLVKMATVKRLDANYLAMLRDLEARFGKAMWRNVILLLTAVPKHVADSTTHIEYRKSLREQLTTEFPAIAADDAVKLPLLSVDNEDLVTSEPAYEALVKRLIPKLNGGVPFVCDALVSPLEELEVECGEIAKALMRESEQCAATENEIRAQNVKISAAKSEIARQKFAVDTLNHQIKMVDEQIAAIG